MFRRCHALARPTVPIAAGSLFSLFSAKRKKLTPLFSNSSILSKKECLPKPFAIKAFRTLLQNTRVPPPPFQIFPRSHTSPISNSHRIIFFAHAHPLTPIESHSYKKQGRGWGTGDLHSTQALPLFSTASKHPTHSNTHCSLFTFLPSETSSAQRAGNRQWLPTRDTAPAAARAPSLWSVSGCR